MEKRIIEIKYARNISFPEARKIVEQPSYAYVTKKGNEEKEDTKAKLEELNKLINELKNLIAILKMIIRDNQGTHFNSSRRMCEIQSKSAKKKKKIQTKNPNK